MQNCDIGLIGIGIMGENLIMNMESKGFSVVGYDIQKERVSEFMEGRAKGHNIFGAYSLKELADALARPRKVMVMIPAGKAVDSVIEDLIPYLEAGDVIIDGGNSHFPDTIRRCKYIESKGLYFVGMGVSGGEEGALKGPSLMPGGSKEAWDIIKPIFQAISAKVDRPCCEWVGENGAGHFVKMVHNGIEYGDMQLICEAYQLLRDLLHLTPVELHEIFKKWNETELNSYLIGITSDIFAFKDSDGLPLIDKILDKAGQKGTGKWTGITSLEEGVPLTLITEAVYARCLSALKSERVEASKLIKKSTIPCDVNKEELIEEIRQALYTSKIISYAQGYSLMHAAAKTYHWNLNYGGIALIWRGGCIIRSAFLDKIKEAYDRNPTLSNLLLDPYFKSTIEKNNLSLRKVVSYAIMSGIPIPAMASSLTYFDGYTSEKLPSNLLQAQRDYFGGHTYQRIDRPESEIFHTNWTGTGGSKSSSNYNV